MKYRVAFHEVGVEYCSFKMKCESYMKNWQEVKYLDNFKFSLQKVLDIKVKDEEGIQIKFSKAQNSKLNIEKELDSLKSNYSRYSNLNSIEDIITQKITANYLDSLSYSIDKTNEELQMKKQELEDVKVELLNKQIERKSLEKLKEDKLKIHKKFKEYKEQSINDEFAMYSYIRNKVHTR